MPFALGSIVDGYEFIDIIDSNPGRIAYRVRNLTDNRIELARVLSRASQDDAEKVERFLREGRVHARLRHPNIVHFYRAVVLNGQQIITTELVEGPTLQGRLEIGLPPLDDVIRITTQVLSALKSAHELGIVHRAVTPQHIILTSSDTAKLSGFGFAKSNDDVQLTRIGVSMGDVHYMSPEQVRGLAVEPVSDIYAVGVVLYQAVTGKRPFDSMSQFEVMAAQVNTVPRAPSRVNPRVPPELDAVILKALAKQPADRYRSAGDFLVALQPFVHYDAPAKLPAKTKALDPAPPIASVPTRHVNGYASQTADASLTGSFRLLLVAAGVLIATAILLLSNRY